MYLALLRQYSTGVLIGLGIALAISIVAFIFAYRKAKTAPYFMWRQEAAKRARLLFGLIFILFLAVGGMIWVVRTQPAPPAAVAKTPSPSATPDPEDTQAGETASAPTLTARAAEDDAAAAPTSATEPEATPTLTYTPAATHTATPVTTRAPANAGMEFVTFAHDVTEDNEPLEPADEFSIDAGPVYAFFKYTSLSNGMEWTFVWSKDSVELSRETQPWEWGAYGQAYLFFKPPGGYEAGEYLLQVLLEDQQLISESFTVQ